MYVRDSPFVHVVEGASYISITCSPLSILVISRMSLVYLSQNNNKLCERHAFPDQSRMLKSPLPDVLRSLSRKHCRDLLPSVLITYSIQHSRGKESCTCISCNNLKKWGGTTCLPRKSRGLARTWTLLERTTCSSLLECSESVASVAESIRTHGASPAVESVAPSSSPVRGHWQVAHDCITSMDDLEPPTKLAMRSHSLPFNVPTPSVSSASMKRRCSSSVKGWGGEAQRINR